MGLRPDNVCVRNSDAQVDDSGMENGATQTINDLFLTLYEMGFEERQVQAALQAGILNVQDAAEWLLQGGECTTRQQESVSLTAGAVSAFNPPLVGRAHSSVVSQRGNTSSSVEPQQALSLSRRNHNLKEFEEQQRERDARQIKAERQKKQKDHELALKRIADDRENLKAKLLPTCQPDPPPQSQRFGDKLQTAAGKHCILVIRLPSGDSLRERFREEDTLQSVKEYITQQCPELLSISLLQGFPKRHFTDSELVSTLADLGLSPTATLCVRNEQCLATASSGLLLDTHMLRMPSGDIVVPEQQAGASASQLCLQSQHSTPRTWGRGELLGYRVIDSPPSSNMDEPPSAPGHRIQSDVREGGMGELMESPSRSRSAHSWGRGRRLAAAGNSSHPNEEKPVGDVAEREAEILIPQHLLIPPAFDPELIFRQNGNRIRSGFEPRYQWPLQGNRLREGREEPAVRKSQEQQDLPSVLAQAALDRLNKAAERQSHHSPLSSQKKLCRATPVPSLFSLAIGSAVVLMAVPSMQYSRSLASLTPELAEHLLHYMINERLLRPKSFEIFFGCQIQKLVLDCYPYTTNELLRKLRAFHSLKHLSLSSCSLITDSGLEVFTSLQRLQYLNLAVCVKLTDNCLCSIKGLRCLSHLVLDQTKVSDSGVMDYLGDAPTSLVHLSLNQTGVSDRVLAVLPSAVPQLRYLSIKHTKVCDVSALKDLPSLQTLHLDNTSISESSLQALGSHSTLSSLSVSGLLSLGGDVTLQMISGLKLIHLKLPDRHSVSDHGLRFLSHLDRLLELDLTDYTHITDEGVSHLGRLLRLTKLSLSNTLLTDAGLVHLQPLLHLEELCLDRTSVGSRAVAHCIRNLPHLQVLSLASTSIGDTVVTQGLRHCLQLLKVNLSQTRITDRGLKNLKQTKVVQVNLDRTGVTLSGVSALLAECPRITSIRANNLHALPLDQASDEEMVAED
ncbi:uncharacterized protein si:ch73-173p19.1 isoform X3 [Hypanus sabinus]|uniref:uncharacterized protein si:ch73-173p19.1 isoform X3 n=1 Tax=Hypanus sabinus TaxID=79690 RepID=UPI0028C4DB4A|nr:uncharacterized protein si:ch73-173p19.1 isoform X3 [Hypanus sabinus]